MVDDANTPEFEWFTKITQGGKAGFVKEFMKDIGAELLLDEYQIIWRAMMEVKLLRVITGEEIVAEIVEENIARGHT